MPKFDHQFDPPSGSSVGPYADLSTREVEDAGLFEVLQTPGVALGTWSLFNALVDSTSPDFRFYEPLGRSREVKVALSGLFGRFVARAYCEKYLGYNYFITIHDPPMNLMYGGGQVERVYSGDLPDWAVWGPSVGLGIVEAKGSHDWPGPARSLARAYTQSQRAEIQVGGRTARFKRYAISTRWGFMQIGPPRPMLWVKDPDESGTGVSEEELRGVGLGIARRHYSSLLKPLGHPELSNALLAMAEAVNKKLFDEAQKSARAILSNSQTRDLTSSSGPKPYDGLIGGFVTRAGPLEVRDLDDTDRETLYRLRLSPTFVGTEKGTLNDIVEGNFERLADTQADRKKTKPSEDLKVPRDDGTGTWVFRLMEDDGHLA